MCVNSGEQDWVCCDKCSVWYRCVCVLVFLCKLPNNQTFNTFVVKVINCDST